MGNMVFKTTSTSIRINHKLNQSIVESTTIRINQRLQKSKKVKVKSQRRSKPKMVCFRQGACPAPSQGLITRQGAGSCELEAA